MRTPIQIAAFLALFGSASAQSIEIPFRQFTLPNGLTYYIRSNSEPPDRADLWLAINAGSNLEDDDQKGLAHFLEHMLFNGTENFPGQELINYLESIGMRFGPDVNAYTSFDETVYTLQVPTDDTEKLQKAFDVLADWSSRATISPEEVEKERGVIVEEWRMRDLNAGGRVNDADVRSRGLLRIHASSQRDVSHRDLGPSSNVRVRIRLLRSDPLEVRCRETPDLDRRLERLTANACVRII